MTALALDREFALFSRDVPTLLHSDPARGGDGSISLNPKKGLVKWNWIAAELNGVCPFVVAANQTEVASLAVESQSGQGDFEASTLLWQSTGRTAVQPYVNTAVVNRYLSNGLISDRLIFGTAQLPMLLPQSIYCLPKSSWQFRIQDLSGLSNTIQPVVFGRRFIDRQQTRARRADFLNQMHPYWIGPQDPANIAQSGPEIALAANGTVQLTFQIPSSADFLCKFVLDDSTSASGVEPLLYGDIVENYTKRSLTDVSTIGSTITGSTNLGLQWRNFMACPTVSVTGFPGGVIRAASIGSPRGGYTHLFPRNSQVVIKFTSLDAAIITLRVALFGWLIYGKEPGNRHFSDDYAAEVDREAQATAILKEFTPSTWRRR